MAVGCPPSKNVHSFIDIFHSPNGIFALFRVDIMEFTEITIYILTDVIRFLI